MKTLKIKNESTLVMGFLDHDQNVKHAEVIQPKDLIKMEIGHMLGRLKSKTMSRDMYINGFIIITMVEEDE